MAVKNRYEFMFYIQCINGNPNGDPDMGNNPRMDPEDLHGYITDVAIKRRIRNYIQLAFSGVPGMNIIIQQSTNTNRILAEIRESIGITSEAKGKGDVHKARIEACRLYYDVRTFGGVLSTGPNAGQIRGPVQLTFARSLDAVLPQDITITRMASTDDVSKGTIKTLENYRKLEDETPEDKLRTMGRKQFISYGLYEVRGFISAGLAAETGFDDNDLKALFESIMNMYEHDRSASKGQMSVISPLIIFRHVGTDSDEKQRERQAMLGCTPAHKLFGLVRAERISLAAPRDYTDYNISINLSAKPAGIDIGFLESAAGEIIWNRISEGSWIHV